MPLCRTCVRRLWWPGGDGDSCAGSEPWSWRRGEAASRVPIINPPYMAAVLSSKTFATCISVTRHVPEKPVRPCALRRRKPRGGCKRRCRRVCGRWGRETAGRLTGRRRPSSIWIHRPPKCNPTRHPRPASWWSGASTCARHWEPLVSSDIQSTDSALSSTSSLKSILGSQRAIAFLSLVFPSS